MTVDKETYFEQQLKDLDFRAEVILAGITMDLAEAIKELRLEQGLSQAELAEKLGTKQSQVSRIENTATATYTLKSLAKIADVLNCDMSVILCRKIQAQATTLETEIAIVPQTLNNTLSSFTFLSVSPTIEQEKSSSSAANNIIKFPSTKSTLNVVIA